MPPVFIRSIGMPPATIPPPNVEKASPKWNLSTDKKDSYSPTPARTKPRSEGRSKGKAKSFKHQELDLKRLHRGDEIKDEKPRINRHSDATNTTLMDGRDGSHEHGKGDFDTPQDGMGNPNMSGISPPQPATLVEPQLQAHDTGFHVITSGTEVGITTVKGIADYRLLCDNPSSMNFSTWRQAKAYYSVCFTDGSVVIRPPQVHTPEQSPTRKRQKVAASPIPTSREYPPLSFPSSPEVPPKSSHYVARPPVRRRIVIVDDSSDENPERPNGMNPTIPLPGSSSSPVVERHTSPPKSLRCTNSEPVVIVYDSEEELAMSAGNMRLDAITSTNFEEELTVPVGYTKSSH